ncbi:hypothetical protein [Bacteroides faecalis]|uniref:Uncharacterized protein n=1 Tax=Bacteroides faecalis TaxID=2447885 RepID=A0A401LVR9_9BACE|nr:hypothetical protein [Bacteroides faecalis]GCB35605.1 hypothetical protein KGMB02408_25500 [Bacteroides faecalis]
MEIKKDTGTSSTDWSQSLNSTFNIAPLEKSNKMTVYMRVINAEGIKDDPIYLSIDATTPIVFEPSGVYYVYGTSSYSSYRLTFRPNPQYEDQEALNNDEQFQVVAVESNQGSRQPKLGFYIDTPSINSSIHLENFWADSYFENWYRNCMTNRSGPNSDLLAQLYFKNKFGRIIAYRTLRCVFRKSF